MNKTPITVLHEFCCKEKLVPEYELTTTDMCNSNPLFKYKVTVMVDPPVISFGEGTSKKKAKHEAAKAAIATLGLQPTIPANKYLSKETDLNVNIQSPNEEDITEDRIGKLKYLCSVKNLVRPTFNVIGIQGPPHDRVYTCECIIASVKETASSRTKQQAKHLVADKMIKRLPSVLNCTEEDLAQCSSKEELDEANKPIEAKVKEVIVEADTEADKVQPHYRVKQSEYHNINIVNVCGFHEDFVEILKNYKDEMDDSIDPQNLLVTNFANCGKTLTFYKLPTTSEEIISSCAMDTVPYFAVFGTGGTFEDANRIAAHKMLLYLKNYL